MLLKEKLLVVWVIAAVVLGFLATHAVRYALDALQNGCAFGVASISLAVGKLGALLATLCGAAM